MPEAGDLDQRIAHRPRLTGQPAPARSSLRCQSEPTEIPVRPACHNRMYVRVNDAAAPRGGAGREPGRGGAVGGDWRRGPVVVEKFWRAGDLGNPQP